MGLKVYLPLAFVVFVAATLGSDLVARTSIAGETLGQAFSEHLYWAAVQAVGNILLLAPFVAVAFICGRTEKGARTRSSAVIFAVGMVSLFYFYFQGYQGAQRAMLDEYWTAAALSVGLLPFFIGVPVVLVALGAGLFATRFDRRADEQTSEA